MKVGLYARGEEEAKKLQAYCEQHNFPVTKMYIWSDNNLDIHATVDRLIAAKVFEDLRTGAIDTLLASSVTQISEGYAYLKTFFLQIFTANEHATVITMDKPDAEITNRNYKRIVALQASREAEFIGYAQLKNEESF